ncbi:MAG: polysaccharide deacetylase family protein [Pseudomonadota bacterium]
MSGSNLEVVESSRKLVILKYHRVLTAPDRLQPGEIDKSGFEAHVSVLSKFFNVLTVADASQKLQTGSLPARAVCITFDDGYADNHDVALPILKSYGVKATFFIATGYLDGGIMWNDRVIEAVRQCHTESIDANEFDLGVLPLTNDPERLSAIKSLLGAFKYLEQPERSDAVETFCAKTGFEFYPSDSPMMSREHVKVMASEGMEIGGHTVTHPILARVDDELAESEIRVGKEELEDLLQLEVASFAYPNGSPAQDYDERHTAMARRAGFASAVSVKWSVARQGCDLFQIPRIWSWDRTRLKFGLRLLKTFYS